MVYVQILRGLAETEHVNQLVYTSLRKLDATLIIQIVHFIEIQGLGLTSTCLQ